MAYSITHKTSGEDSTNTTSYNTPSILVTANRLIIGVFRANNQPSGVSGGGITWTYYATVTNGTAHFDLYLGVATSPSNGAITISYGSTQNECCWSIVETSVPVVGNVTNYIQQVASNTGTSITSLTVTLPNQFGTSDNVTLGFIAIFENAAITQGSGFTELGEANGAGGSIEAEWFQGQDLTVDWSFSSATGVVAFGIEVGDPGNNAGYAYFL